MKKIWPRIYGLGISWEFVSEISNDCTRVHRIAAVRLTLFYWLIVFDVPLTPLESAMKTLLHISWAIAMVGNLIVAMLPPYTITNLYCFIVALFLWQDRKDIYS